MNLDSITGHVVLLMAPTGSGKGTLVRHALEQFPDIYFTVSCTTRAMRPGEEDGKNYYFISHEQFAEKIANDEFIEWAEFSGNRYGTLKSEIIPKLTECRVVLTEIEVQGVEQLMSLLPRDHMTIVFVEAGGWEGLKARALDRAPMSEAELAARHERYQIEKTFKDWADVVIDNTTDVEIAKAEFGQVIAAAYRRCELNNV